MTKKLKNINSNLKKIRRINTDTTYYSNNKNNVIKKSN